MNVVKATTHLRVIQNANTDDTSLPPKLQSDLAHLLPCASPPTKAVIRSQQSLTCHLMGVLNASIGIQALHPTHPITALPPTARAVTKVWAAHWGLSTSIPSRATRAAWPHFLDAMGPKVKAAYTRHTTLLLHRMTHTRFPKVREVAIIMPQPRSGLATHAHAGYSTRWACRTNTAPKSGPIYNFCSLPHTTPSSHLTPARIKAPWQSSAETSSTTLKAPSTTSISSGPQSHWCTSPSPE